MVTWVGHATVLIEADGYRVLTDPALMPRMAHLCRRVPEAHVGSVDAVLISHVHMDHLHLGSLRLVAGGARVIVPEGAAPLVRRVGAASIESVKAGSRVSLRAGTEQGPPVKVEVVPANHLDGRGPHSRVRAQPVGYVLSVGDRRIYFAGDTDLFDEMDHLGPLDIALIPIWGWGPTLGERHLNPSTAATATARLDPRIVVPIHWGTYSPLRARRGSPPWLDDPVAAFRGALEAQQLGDRLIALAPGGYVQLD